MPPGRTTMARNSASLFGLSIGIIGTRGVASVVNDDTPVRSEDTELPPVGTALGGALDAPEPPPPARAGSRYSTGMGTQLLECGKVPCLRSETMLRKSGVSTPVWSSETLMLTACR